MSNTCPKCGSAFRRRVHRHSPGETIYYGAPVVANATQWDCLSIRIDGEAIMQSWACRAIAAEAEVERLQTVIGEMRSSNET